MRPKLMKSLYFLPLSFVLISQGFAEESFFDDEDWIEEYESDELAVTQPQAEKSGIIVYDSEDEEENDEEEEEKPDEPETTQTPPAPAQGAEGRRNQLRQERAAQIQRKRELRAQAKQRPAPVAQAPMPSARKAKRVSQAPTQSQQPTTPQAQPTTPATPQAQPTTPSTQPQKTQPPKKNPYGPPPGTEPNTPAPQKPTSATKAPRTRRATAQTESLKSSKRPSAARLQKKVVDNTPAPSKTSLPSPSKAPEGVNLSARPVLHNANLWIVGDALLWQATQDNMEYVYEGVDSEADWNIQSPSFDWNWGFRAGIGYNIPHDRWDLGLSWTSINNHAHDHIHKNLPTPVIPGTEVLYNVWTTQSNTLTSGSSASAHWESKLNQIDLNLGRNFYVGHYLSMHPYAGIRNAWINQTYRINFEGLNALSAPVTQENHMTNNSWGIGFCGGVGADWMLTRRFSIYGDAGMAVLMGFFHIHQTGSENNVSVFRVSKNFRAGRPIFDLALGFKWATNFFHNHCRFALKVGYEYHLYCNQNQFMQSNGSTDLELFNPIRGDLSYQGGTISGRLDF